MASQSARSTIGYVEWSGIVDLSYLGVFDRIYTYARVSSIEQAEVRNSIEGQENRLAAIRPAPSAHYRDIMGGDRASRRDYQRLIEQVRSDSAAGLLVLVVVTEQSRLSREDVGAVTALVEEFDRLNVCLFALDGGRLTMKEPHEYLAIGTASVYNAFFLRQHKRRLRSSKAQRRVEGRPLNPNPPKGYLYSRDRYLIDPEWFDLCRRLVTMYLPEPMGEGRSLLYCSNYATAQGWRITPHGFQVWLQNPVLRGHLRYTKGGHSRDDQRSGIKRSDREEEWHYNTHDPLLSGEEYRAILTRAGDNQRRSQQSKPPVRHPLSGLVWCGSCNHRMTINANVQHGKRYPNFQCKHLDCANRWRSKSAPQIERALQAAIAAKAVDLAQLTVESTTTPEGDPRVLDLQRQIQELQAMHRRSPLSGIRDAIEELEARLSAHTKKPAPDLSAERLGQAIAVFADPSNFDRLSDAQKRLVYFELCDRLVLEEDRSVSVHLNL